MNKTQKCKISCKSLFNDATNAIRTIKDIFKVSQVASDAFLTQLGFHKGFCSVHCKTAQVEYKIFLAKLWRCVRSCWHFLSNGYNSYFFSLGSHSHSECGARDFIGRTNSKHCWSHDCELLRYWADHRQKILSTAKFCNGRYYSNLTHI